MEKTIEIPEGYEARIEGNKVILERKESEDERIRKELIEFLDELWHLGKNTNFDRWGKADCAKWIAYLERQKGIVMHTPRYAPPEQKEQKPVQDREEREYVRTIKSLIADFLRGKDEIDREYYQKIYDWLDGRHIEQNPSEWQRERMEDEHGKELLYVCQATAEREHRSGIIEGKAQAEKDLIPLINRLCEAILFEWKDAADLARKTLTQIKAREEEQ